jgi:hypothetical protein
VGSIPTAGIELTTNIGRVLAGRIWQHAWRRIGVALVFSLTLNGVTYGVPGTPYLSNSLKSSPHSSDHDVVLAAALTLLWGTIFFWDTIGRKWHPVRLAIEALLGLMVLSGMAALYGTIVYLILKK